MHVCTNKDCTFIREVLHSLIFILLKYIDSVNDDLRVKSYSNVINYWEVPLKWLNTLDKSTSARNQMSFQLWQTSFAGKLHAGFVLSWCESCTLSKEQHLFKLRRQIFVTNTDKYWSIYPLSWDKPTLKYFWGWDPTTLLDFWSHSPTSYHKW